MDRFHSTVDVKLAEVKSLLEETVRLDLCPLASILSYTWWAQLATLKDRGEFC